MTGTDWLIVPIVAVAALVVLRKLFAGKSKRSAADALHVPEKK